MRIGKIALVAIALLLAASWCDLKSRNIPNGLNLAIALLAIPFWWVSGLAFWPDMAMQVAVALLVFALFAAAFAVGMMGGGDVKMIGALALWFPFNQLMTMLIVMSLAGGAITLIMLIDKWMRRKTAQPEVPYGIAIAIAALLTVREPILNQFA